MCMYVCICYVCVRERGKETERHNRDRHREGKRHIQREEKDTEMDRDTHRQTETWSFLNEHKRNS